MTYHSHVDTPIIRLHHKHNYNNIETSVDRAESPQSHTLSTRQSWLRDVSVPAITAPGCGNISFGVVQLNGMAVGEEGTVHSMPLARTSVRNDQ